MSDYPMIEMYETSMFGQTVTVKRYAPQSSDEPEQWQGMKVVDGLMITHAQYERAIRANRRRRSAE